MKIAEVFGKEHRNVIRDIRDVIKQAGGMLKNEQTPMFEETTYIHEQNGQTYPMYYLNRDGFTLLAMASIKNGIAIQRLFYFQNIIPSVFKIKTIIYFSFNISYTVQNS